MELLRIEYNNKWYYVEQDGKSIKYYRKDNKKKNYDLSIDEMKLIQFSIDSITPSNNLIKLMNYKHHGKIYEVSMDTKTGLHFFNPKPNFKDFIELNMLFNNQHEYLEDKVVNDTYPIPNDEETLIKRVTSYGKQVVLILITAALIRPIFDNAVHTGDLVMHNNYIRATVDTSTMDDYDFVWNIRRAIARNPNLSDKEKAEIISCFSEDFLLDNKKYIDYDYAIKTLSTIKITYNKGPYSKKTSRTGYYDDSRNEIIFYNANGFDDVDKTVFSHEVYHTIGQMTWSNCQSFLIETTNTIYNEEYTGKKERNSYQVLLKYTKALMEIIGPEPFKRYQFMASNEFIIKPLTMITGSENDAKRLLANLDNYKNISSKSCKTVEEQREKEENLANLNDIIIEQLATYYSAKYNRDYRDDLIMLYYLDVLEFDKELRDKFNLSDDYLVQTTKPIIYFRDNEKSMWVEYDKNGVIILNERNRFINKTKTI